MSTRPNRRQYDGPKYARANQRERERIDELEARIDELAASIAEDDARGPCPFAVASDEAIAWKRRRYDLGLSLWHPGDRPVGPGTPSTEGADERRRGARGSAVPA